VDIDRFVDGLPAMAAAQIRSDEIDAAVVGAAAVDDSFHLGSNTSAPAVLDVEGSPGITLERLLAHASGVRPLTEDDELAELPRERSEVARPLVSESLLFEPGTDNTYSNGGYTVAAAMLEEVTGATWRERVST